MLGTLGLHAQTTRVKGRVTDAQTGEGIAFAGVYFKNSTVGVSTDDEGYYALEVRNNSLTILSASILGYETIGIRLFLCFLVRGDGILCARG